MKWLSVEVEIRSVEYFRVLLCGACKITINIPARYLFDGEERLCCRYMSLRSFARERCSDVGLAFRIDLMFSLLLFVLGMLVSAVAVHYSILASHRFGIVDRPGGHKAHDTVTPFVGGVGVLVATLVGFGVIQVFFPALVERMHAFLFGVIILFVTGFADDVLHLNYKIRFVVQAGVGLAMVLWGGVVISDLGGLGSGPALSLGFLSIPITLLATIGAINALNMIDGIDGLSGFSP